MKLKNEPALIVGFVQAVLALAVSFGLGLSVDQVGAIVAVAAAATSVLLRQQVSPVSSTQTPHDEPPPASGILSTAGVG
jgi:hypothetical protein